MQKVPNARRIYGLLAANMPADPPDATTRIRQRIARLLDDRGYTQRALAQALGHGDQWASNLLSGRSRLSLTSTSELQSKYMTIKIRRTGEVYKNASYLGVSWARVWVGGNEFGGGRTGWLHFRTDEFDVF